MGNNIKAEKKAEEKKPEEKKPEQKAEEKKAEPKAAEKKTAEKNHYRRILFYTRRNSRYHKTVLRERDIVIRIIP